VVTALLRAMDRRLSGEPVFNICTGRATTVPVWSRSRDPVPSGARGSTAAKQALGAASYTEFRIGLSATLAWLEGVCEAQ